MAEWKYGVAGDIYPVKLGDLWLCGNHEFQCNDFQNIKGWINGLFESKYADVVYCDPPWNAGNATAFRTKAGMPSKVIFGTFLRNLARVIQDCKGNVFLEMGVKEENEVCTVMEDAGARLLKVWEITYYKKRPCRLGMFTWREKADEIELDLDGWDEELTPYEVLRQYPKGSKVYDPCCGRGLTSRAAEKAGLKSMGLELAPRRMADALMRMEKLTGSKPLRLFEGPGRPSDLKIPSS